MIRCEFRLRAQPLTPCAALYPRRDAPLLGERLELESSSEVTGAVTENALVLLGPTNRLPWTPHARYFGRDEAAPRLLLSTALAPTVPLDLLERSLARETNATGPWLLDDVEKMVISLAAARAISLVELARWGTSEAPP